MKGQRKKHRRVAWGKQTRTIQRNIALDDSHTSAGLTWNWVGPRGFWGALLSLRTLSGARGGWPKMLLGFGAVPDDIGLEVVDGMVNEKGNVLSSSSVSSSAAAVAEEGKLPCST